MTINNKFYGRADTLGVRSQKYNTRRRAYGTKAFAGDIDMLLYNNQCQSIAMFEEKDPFYQQPLDLFSFQMKCHREMCDKLQIPLFMIFSYFYGLNNKVLRIDQGNDMTLDNMNKLITHCQYLVVPCNKLAVAVMDSASLMTEKQFLTLEYELRGIELDPELANSVYDFIIPIPDWQMVEIIDHDYKFEV